MPRGLLHEASTSVTNSLHFTLTVPSCDYCWSALFGNYIKAKSGADGQQADETTPAEAISNAVRICGVAKPDGSHEKGDTTRSGAGNRSLFLQSGFPVGNLDTGLQGEFAALNLEDETERADLDRDLAALEEAGFLDILEGVDDPQECCSTSASSSGSPRDDPPTASNAALESHFRAVKERLVAGASGKAVYRAYVEKMDRINAEQIEDGHRKIASNAASAPERFSELCVRWLDEIGFEADRESNAVIFTRHGQHLRMAVEPAGLHLLSQVTHEKKKVGTLTHANADGFEKYCILRVFAEKGCLELISGGQEEGAAH